MKNFLVYAKTPLNQEVNIDEASSLMILRQSFRFAYLFDFVGVIYAFQKRFYLLGFVLLFLTIMATALANVWVEALFFKLALNVVLAIFGLEVEEFFARRKGLKLQGFAFGKNAKEVQGEIEGKMKIRFYKQSRFRRLLDRVKRRFCKFRR
jgi:hypothetical protein